MTRLLGNFTFWQEVLLNVVGPLVTVLLGTLLIGFLASWITRRAQDHREDRALRERLIAQVTEAPTALYLATQRYWRAQDTFKDSPEKLQEPKNILDDQYQKSSVDGRVLEGRLLNYFESDRPRLLCHRVMDLLTVRYFQLASEKDRFDRICEVNAGDEHSGLSAPELHDRKTVLRTYHATMEELIEAVLKEELVLGRSPN